MRNIQADSKIGTLFNYTWHQLKIEENERKKNRRQQEEEEVRK